MSSLGLGVWADAEPGDRPGDDASKNQIAARVPARREVPLRTRVELSINSDFDTMPTKFGLDKDSVPFTMDPVLRDVDSARKMVQHVNHVPDHENERHAETRR
jgi:hypothetical protein